MKLAALVFAGLAAADSRAADPVIYRITRDGSPIGHYQFSVRNDGVRQAVAVHMMVKVKVLFITVYHAVHDRVETWEDGRLVRLEGTSRYNGDPYALEYAEAEGRAVLRVNGATREVSGPIVTLGPRRPAVSGDALLLTEKGRLLPVTITHAGRETLAFGGRPVEADRYRLNARTPRDVWYAADGTLLQVRYENRGSVIEIRRAASNER